MTSILGGGFLLDMCAADLMKMTVSVSLLKCSDSNDMCHSPSPGVLYPLSMAPCVVLFRSRLGRTRLPLGHQK